VFLSVLCLFAVHIFRFGFFQGKLILDEGMSTTVAFASGSDRYVGEGEQCSEWGHLFFTGCISIFRDFAENDEKGYYPGTVIY
jgi:hypothetical protein